MSIERIASRFVAGTLVATSVIGGVAPNLALAHDKIEMVEVGDRVLTAPGLDQEGPPTFDTAVTRAWQVIDLELAGTDDAGKRRVVALTVLRPPDWLRTEDPDGDGAFALALPELRLRGLAHVVNVRGPPTLAPRPGRVVLATVVHASDDVLSLELAPDDAALGGVTEIRATANHPFYSLARRDWVAAGDLAIGERVQTERGAHTLAARTPLPGTHAVYNLEVERDHEYLVGDVGARVHNTYPGGAGGGGGGSLQGGARLPDNRIQSPPSRRGNAPTGDDGHPVELHHRDQTPDDPIDEMTRTDHRGAGNFSDNHPNTGQEPSKIDRRAWRRQQREYWRQEWDSGRFGDGS